MKLKSLTSVSVESGTLTVEGQRAYTLEFHPTVTPVHRRSPAVRAEQERRDRERVRLHEARVAPVRTLLVQPRTSSVPRVRSREMSHAPRRAARSTPKAGSRSGDTGDPDPAGSSAPLWRRFIVDEHYLVVGVVS